MEGKEFKIISAKTVSLCILSGIAVAQLISCLDLFQSNSQLAKTIHALNQAGYRVVPAGEALTSLGEKMAAFAGALFLSLTAGTAIATAATTILIILSCYLWRQNRLNLKKSITMRSALISLFFWSTISLLIIVAEESSFTAAYTFFIPLAIAALFFLLSAITEKKRAEQNKNLELTQCAIDIQSKIDSQNKRQISLIFIISLSIAASFYFSRCDRSLFLRARDYILLSSRPGELLNEFYYRYTLYAAEAIKPHTRKEINLSSAYHKINPYSEKDNHRIMRLLCLAGLTVVLPILSYLYSFVLICYIVRLCTILLIRLCSLRICSISLFSLNFKMVQNGGVVLISGTISGIIITGLSVAFLYHLYPLSLYDDKATHNIYRGSDMRIKDILYHSDYRIRVEGLREICVQSSTSGEIRRNYGESRTMHGEGSRRIQIEKKTIWNYPEVITRTMRCGEIAERYWLANAFAAAKEHSALPYLEKLIDDPSINVQCAAIAAVATIGMELQPDMVNSGSERDSLQSDLNSVLNMPHILRRKIIDLLERKMVKSSEWYVQKSAYDGLEKIRKI